MMMNPVGIGRQKTTLFHFSPPNYLNSYTIGQTLRQLLLQFKDGSALQSPLSISSEDEPFPLDLHHLTLPTRAKYMCSKPNFSQDLICKAKQILTKYPVSYHGRLKMNPDDLRNP